MRRKLMWALIAATIAGVTAYVGTVRATPAFGFTGTTLAVGRFADIEAFNQVIAAGPDKKNRIWTSLQKTKGASDLYVQSNVWTPGGSTGWHTHPGHSLIIVTAGTVTGYHGDDPTCTPHVYSTGEGFVDEGGEHTHLLRNEGSVEARTIAVQLVPASAVRRIDAAAPAACGF